MTLSVPTIRDHQRDSIKKWFLMTNDRNMLRRIAWSEICPWLMLVRCFRLAISPTVLCLATLGLLLMPLGDWATQRFIQQPKVQPVLVDQSVRQHHRVPFMVTRYDLRPYPWGGLGENMAGVYLDFFHPISKLFDRSLSSSELLAQFFRVLWRLAVWSLAGGAITRIAMVHLGRDERVSLWESLRHAIVNFGWYLGAPLFPLLGVALSLVPLAILGLIMRLDVGAFFVALVWPFALLGALGMAVLLIDVLAGWPLMWPTISAEEGSDSFEAFSRSFSFTYQRPLQYMFYAVIAMLLGGLGGLFAANVGNAVMVLNEWALSFGAGNPRLDDVLAGAQGDGQWVAASSAVIDWWNELVRTIVAAFSYAFFFCAASAIYLLLRRDLDQTDFDEVFMSDQSTRFGTQPLSIEGESTSE